MFADWLALVLDPWRDLRAYVAALHSSGTVETWLRAYLVVFVMAFALVMWRSLCSFFRRPVRPVSGEVSDGTFAADPDWASADVVVTLIHGTWARSAAWCRPASSFQQALRESLAREGVRKKVAFRRFQWSGRNAILDRDRGATHLQEAFDAGNGLSSGQVHFVIGHSHGGAVGLGALLRLHASGRDSDVRGLACLGTPFLVASRRSGFALMISMAALAPVGSVAYVSRRYAQDVSAGPGPWQIALLLTSIAAVVVFAYFSLRVSKALLPGNGLPPAVADRLLAIRCAGDEASAALSVAFIANWLINKGASLLTLSGWGLIDDVGRQPLRRWLALLGNAGLWVVAALAAGQAVQQASHDLSPEIAPVVTALLWLVAALVSLRALMALLALVVRAANDTLLTPLQVVVQTILSAVLFPFGPELILASPRVLVTVEPVPPTESPSARPEFYLLPTDGNAGLNHSVHAHPGTAQLLARWIAQRVQ